MSTVLAPVVITARTATRRAVARTVDDVERTRDRALEIVPVDFPHLFVIAQACSSSRNSDRLASCSKNSEARVAHPLDLAAETLNRWPFDARAGLAAERARPVRHQRNRPDLVLPRVLGAGRARGWGARPCTRNAQIAVGTMT